MNTTQSMWHGKHVCVFGIGKSGLASLKLLHQHGAVLYAGDDSENGIKQVKALPFADEVTIADIDDMPWEEMFTLVLSPGIPFTHPTPHAVVKHAHEHGVPIICDVELLWHKHRDAKYVGITGTNGKSTTTALIGHILKEAGHNVAVGGNIGTAAADLADKEHDIYVLELSSFQLDLLEKTKLDVAVLLNITRDHIDRHGSMEHYIAVKETIFNLLRKKGLGVVTADDAHTQAIYKRLSARKQEVHGEEALDLCTKRLSGQHNAQNIAAARAVCLELGVEEEAIKKAISSFPGLAHRTEWVAENAGVQFVNDSKATNAEAAQHALSSFANIYWILGGRAKDGGIEALTPYFGSVKRAYLIGEATEQLRQTLEAEGVDYKRSETLELAVPEAYQDAKKEGAEATVLLSPACASFDQFANFEIRGDAFKAIVMELDRHVHA